MKTNIEINTEAREYAKINRLYGDQTDLIQGYEAGYKAGYKAKENEK